MQVQSGSGLIPINATVGKVSPAVNEQVSKTEVTKTPPISIEKTAPQDNSQAQPISQSVVSPAADPKSSLDVVG